MDIATLGIAVDSRQIKEADRSLGGLTSAASKAERATEGLSSAAGALKGALAGLSVGLVASKFIEAERATGILNVQLKTATGSADAASAKFTELTALATRLPSSLQDVTQAFVKLKNLGLDPSERAIISYSNTAAAMGKTLNDMIEAVADASTGEFERLKEFGIRAKTQGDQIQFTFQGVTTSVKNNAESITEYLTRIGEVNFAGAATERMNTLDGAISNLNDSVDSLLRKINDSATGQAMIAATKALSNAVGFLADNLDRVVGLLSASAFVASAGTLASAAASMKLFGDRTEEAAAKLTDLTAAQRELASLQERLARSSFGPEVVELNRKVREQSAVVETLTAKQKAQTDALQAQFRASERLYGAQTEQQKKVTASVKKTTEAKQAQRKATQDAASDLPTVGEQYQRFIAQQVLMAQETDRASKALSGFQVATATASTQVFGATVGQLQEMQAQMAAVNLAAQQFPQYAAGYSTMMRQLAVDTANLKLQLGDGSFQDAITSITGQLAGNFTNVLDGLTTRFGDFYSSIASGAADSIGQAIVYGDSLGDSLTNVAKSAVSSLISSFVELGIQYVANAALGQTVSATAAATSATLAAATSAAWATPAALVNAATFGGGAVAGTTALASSVAAAQGLALAGMAGFKDGGYTGNVGTSDVAGVVHGREFVMNAAATAANRPALEAMNRGQSAGTQVVIENYAPGVVVEQVDESRFRVIAAEEANRAISNRAPEVIAADMANPNGRTSKSMAQNFNLSRRRA